MMNGRKALRVAMILLLSMALIPGAALAQQDQKKKKKKKKKVQTVVVEVFDLYDQGDFEGLAAKIDEAKEGGVLDPEALYLDGLARQRLQQDAVARTDYAALADRAEDDVWHWIGASARDAADGQLESALKAADKAVELAATNKLARYQRGRVLTQQGQHATAAAAYVEALKIDGDFAYAHYYAGMSYHQSGNLVAASNHLTRFLELAPDAPEKVQVQGILATIRG